MRELHSYEPTSEVDNMRERYSAARYILHLKATFEGNFKGRGEWSRVIKNMSPDDACAFWADFDALTEDGALVHVLTPEEREAVKASVLEKLDEYRELGDGLMKDFGVPVELMHRIEQDPSTEAEWDDDDDLAAWAEDDEDADFGVGEER